MNNYLVNVINSLKFFTADGHQIQMQKEYNVSWEIIPADEVYGAFIKNPKGHFMQKPVNMFIDVFNETSYDVNNGQCYQFKNNEYILESDDMENYIISKTVKLQNSTEYAAVLDMQMDCPAILILDKGYNIIGHYNGKSSYASLHEYHFTYSDILKDYPKAGHIRLQTRKTGEYSLFTTSNYVDVIIDEPGLINPNVDFYRK